MKNIFVFLFLIVFTSFAHALDFRKEAAEIDLGKAVLAISKANLSSKGEEEKTIEFQKKIQNFRLNGKSLTEKFFVYLKPASLDFCSLKPQPDSDSFSFSCKIDLTYGSIDFTESRVKLSSGSYVGVNAFNRKIVVQKSKYMEKRIHFEFDDLYNLRKPLTFSVENIPSKAGSIRKDYSKIEMALVFLIKTPYAFAEIKSKSPTINDPEDITTISLVLYVSPLELHVLSGRNSKPLRSFKFVPVWDRVDVDPYDPDSQKSSADISIPVASPCTKPDGSLFSHDESECKSNGGI